MAVVVLYIISYILYKIRFILDTPDWPDISIWIDLCSSRVGPVIVKGDSRWSGVHRELSMFDIVNSWKFTIVIISKFDKLIWLMF